MNKAHLSLYFFPSLFISFYFFSAYNVHSAYFVTDFANQGFYYIGNMLTTDSGLGNNREEYVQMEQQNKILEEMRGPRAFCRLKRLNPFRMGGASGTT